MKKLVDLKKFVCFGLAIAVATPAVVHAENPITILKEYGIPCAITIGASAALVKQDGLLIGATMCAGISAATALNRKIVDNAELKMVVDKSLEEKEKRLIIKLDEQLDQKAKKIAEDQEKRNEDLRKIIREILADRLIKMEDDLRSSVQKMIDNGTFLSELEKRINAKVKEEVISEGKVRSKELVNQIADEVIRQVVAKPIAVPEANQ
jgi:hypothetical protein